MKRELVSKCCVSRSIGMQMKVKLDTGRQLEYDSRSRLGFFSDIQFRHISPYLTNWLTSCLVLICTFSHCLVYYIILLDFFASAVTPWLKALNIRHPITTDPGWDRQFKLDPGHESANRNDIFFSCCSPLPEANVKQQRRGD